jgi:ABC-3C protein
MRRDYRLYELNADEFEKLVVQICVRWLGVGVTPFAPGKDGGRDGRFHGKANCFPSVQQPIEGHCVLQAKHAAAPNKSCSDRDFGRLLKSEHPKIKKLVKAAICDHYIVFTNRKLTGGADQTLIQALMKLKVTTAHIVGTERLHLALDEYPDIRDNLPNKSDLAPFRFEPDELVEVIGALHEYTGSESGSEFDSAHDFDAVKIRDHKNKVNGLTADYFQQIIVNGSMPHFPRIEEFLKNPRNKEFAALYHDAADELKQKILSNRAKFDAFDDVFAFIYEQIQTKRAALRGKRRLVSILLHYMYFNCDIGSKDANDVVSAADAHP